MWPLARTGGPRQQGGTKLGWGYKADMGKPKWSGATVGVFTGNPGFYRLGLLTATWQLLLPYGVLFVLAAAAIVLDMFATWSLPNIEVWRTNEAASVAPSIERPGPGFYRGRGRPKLPGPRVAIYRESFYFITSSSCRGEDRRLPGYFFITFVKSLKFLFIVATA